MSPVESLSEHALRGGRRSRKVVISAVRMRRDTLLSSSLLSVSVVARLISGWQ